MASNPTEPGATLEARRAALLEVVRAKGYLRLPDPVRLRSGEMSQDFVDGKKALAAGPDLALACGVIADDLAGRGLSYEAVGGLTMGADQFAHGIAMVAGVDWFVVRKEPKGRGTNQLVEGADLSGGPAVLLVDDVVTTGGSIQKAHDAVVEAGGRIVAAVTLVDRGDVAAAWFDERDVPYHPVFTYRDLGIVPVGGV